MAGSDRKNRGMYDNSERENENSAGEEQIKLSPEYARFVHRAVKKGKDEKSQAIIGQVLGSRDVQSTYEILRKEGISDTTIYNIMTSDSALNRMYKTKGKLNRTDFLEGVVKSLRRNEHYENVVEEMYDQEVIDERRYTEMIKDVESDSEKHLKMRIPESVLERKVKHSHAAVWLFMAVGAILMLVSGSSMTGKVIGGGSTFEFSFLFVIGFVLFVMGLILSLRKN